MKKKINEIVIVVVVVFMVILVIAVKKFKHPLKIEFHCDANDHQIDYFYEDGEYEYYYPTWGRHIIYKKEKIPFKEALDRKLITMRDIDEIAKEKPECKYDKRRLTE